MTAAKYAVHLTEEGALRIIRTDGSPIRADTVDWFRKVLRSALRAEAQSKTFIDRQQAVIDDRVANALSDDKPARFKVDEIIVFLEFERITQGLTRAAVARAIFTQTQRLTDYARGWARPTTETLRLWAFVLGWNIMPVPHDLSDQVNELVREWVIKRNAALPEVESR